MRAAIRPVLVALGAIFAALSLAATVAQAAWPERPVTVMVPFTAGGITDVLARLMAERLQVALKQPFIVENAPGAAGVIAAERVLKAAPDGYTLLFTPVFQITMAPFTTAATFDPVKDFKPVTVVGTSPFVVTVGAEVPAMTLPAFIAYVKARPGQMPFGSAGTGSLSHVPGGVFLKSAGLDMVHVPYRGLGAAFTDLIAGHVSMVIGDAGRAQILSRFRQDQAARGDRDDAHQAIAGRADGRRDAAEPAVITLNGLVAPGRTPQEIVDRSPARSSPRKRAPPSRSGWCVSASTRSSRRRPSSPRSSPPTPQRWRDVVRELDLKPH